MKPIWMKYILCVEYTFKLMSHQILILCDKKIT